MDQIPVPTNELLDFLCPSCGAAAFEVVDRQRNSGEGDDAGEFLVLRCFACLEWYYHPLGLPGPTNCLLN